jgi:hypothetical protein
MYPKLLNELLRLLSLKTILPSTRKSRGSVRTLLRLNIGCSKLGGNLVNFFPETGQSQRVTNSPASSF